MEIVLSLVALGVAFSGGWGAACLLAPGRFKDNPCLIIGTSLVLGAAIVTIFPFLLGFFLLGAPLRAAISLLCLSLPAMALVRGASGLNRRDLLKWRRPDANALILAVLVLVQLSLITWLSLYRFDLGWDGLFNWEFKARVAFSNHGALPLDFYRSGYEVSHVAYPVLVPLLEVWIYEWIGHVNQSLAKLVGPYFYLTALLLLIGASKTQPLRRWSAIVAVLTFGLVPALVLGAGSATSGYADFPLAVVALCALAHSVDYWTTGSRASARLGGAAAMALPFVKAEGSIALIAFVIAVAPKCLRDRDWRAAGWLLIPGFSVWMGWNAFLRLTDAPRLSEFLPMTPANFLAHWNRAPDLLRWTWEELVAWNHWSILWPLAAVALVLALAGRLRLPWFPIAANVFLPLAVYPTVFFFSAWNPVEPHVLSSLWRLFLHSVPGVVWLIGIAAGEVLETSPAEALDGNFPNARAVAASTGIWISQWQRIWNVRKPVLARRMGVDAIPVAAIFLGCAYRAFTIPVTGPQARRYLSAVVGPWTAHWHLLDPYAILARLLDASFGPSVFTVRTPGLLGWLVLLMVAMAAAQMLSRHRRSLAVVSFLAVLVIQPVLWITHSATPPERDILREIRRLSPPFPDHPMRVASTCGSSPALEFYRRAEQVTNVGEIDCRVPTPVSGYDFYLLTDQEWMHADSRGLIAARHYDAAGLVLLVAAP